MTFGYRGTNMVDIIIGIILGLIVIGLPLVSLLYTNCKDSNQTISTKQ